MTDQITKAELLDRINISYTTWETLIGQIPADRWTEPGFSGDEWSLKDVVAHITVYERWTADMLAAAAHGETGWQTFAWEPEGSAIADMNERNAFYHRYYKDVPLAEVMAASRENHQQMVAAVEALSESDLNATDKFTWTGGQPVWKATEGNSYEHYDDHGAMVRAWLATASAK